VFFLLFIPVHKLMTSSEIFTISSKYLFQAVLNE